MSIREATGAGPISFDALVLQVQRSNSETQRGILEEAGSRFESRKAAVEAERARVNAAESDVLGKEATLDEHVAAGPNPLDAFFLKGAFHEGQTKALKADVAAEQADVHAAEVELKGARHELADTLELVRTTLDTMNTHRSDTESLLEVGAEASALILGRVKA